MSVHEGWISSTAALYLIKDFKVVNFIYVWYTEKASFFLFIKYADGSNIRTVLYAI